MIRTFAAALATTTCMVALATPAIAQTREYNIPAGSLKSALDAYVRQSGRQVIYRADEVRSARSPGVRGQHSPDEALSRLLSGSGFTTRIDGSLVAIVRSGNGEVADSASSLGAEGGSTGEVIVVTGSNIRSVGAAASPVQVYDREAISRTGAATMQEFFARIPQNFAGGANPRDSAGLTDDGSQNIGQGAAINLRGLGVGTTLTLIDGRRVAATGTRPFVDISTIPTSAIDRVEVLTDGASAIYGSDAVGGVVNFILRKDFEGVETDARFATVTQGSRQQYSASAVAGKNWKTGNVMAVYNYIAEDRLDASSKTFSRAMINQPFDLYPETESHSLVGKVSQFIGNDIRAELSGFYATRSADSRSTSTSGNTIRVDYSGSATETFGLSADITASLSDFWQLRAAAGYSTITVDNVINRIPSSGASTQFSDTTTSDLSTFNISADGPVFSIAGGSVSLAVGGSFSEEGYKLDQGFIVEDTRTVYSMYGELSIPLVSSANRAPGFEKLHLSAALRFDDYSDFGQTVNSKVGVIWEPIDSIALRATYSTSFRAPGFRDLYDSNTQTSLASFNQATPYGLPPIVHLFTSGGNESLQPERAETWTFGPSFRKTGRTDLELKINYYNVKYTDRISSGAPGGRSQVFTNPEAFDAILIRNPAADEVEFYRQLGVNGIRYQEIRTGASALPAGTGLSDVQLIIDNRLRNNAGTFQDGIDIFAGAGYNIDQDVKLGWNFNGHYIISRTQRLTSTSPQLSNLNIPYFPVDLAFRTSLTANVKRWYSSLSWNHVDGYRDPARTPSAIVKAWDTIDLYVSYTSPDGSPPFLKGVVASLSVTNLLDSAPPFVSAPGFGPNFDPANADSLGRVFAIGISKRW